MVGILCYLNIHVEAICLAIWDGCFAIINILELITFKILEKESANQSSMKWNCFISFIGLLSKIPAYIHGAHKLIEYGEHTGNIEISRYVDNKIWLKANTCGVLQQNIWSYRRQTHQKKYKQNVRGHRRL